MLLHLVLIEYTSVHRSPLVGNDTLPGTSSVHRSPLVGTCTFPGTPSVHISFLVGTGTFPGFPRLHRSPLVGTGSSPVPCNCTPRVHCTGVQLRISKKTISLQRT